MRRFFGCAFILFAAATAVASCKFTQANDQSLFIRQINVGVAPACAVTNDPTGPFVTEGVLDVGLRSSYQVNALIGNQLVSRGDPKLVRSEPNRIIITGADIHLLDDTGTETDFYSVTATGFADPTTSADASYGLATFDLLPASIGQRFFKDLVNQKFRTVRTVVAKMKVYGQTLGNRDVESSEYAFPVQICYGCTVQFPAGTSDPTLPQPNCLNAQAATTTTTSSPPGATACPLGQDGSAICTQCQGFAVCTPCSTDAQCGLNQHCVPELSRCSDNPT